MGSRPVIWMVGTRRGFGVSSMEKMSRKPTGYRYNTYTKGIEQFSDKQTNLKMLYGGVRPVFSTYVNTLQTL